MCYPGHENNCGQSAKGAATYKHGTKITHNRAPRNNSTDSMNHATSPKHHAGSSAHSPASSHASASPIEQNPFFDLGLIPELCERVAKIGYTTPTAIQKEAIPLVLEGHDVIGIAQTGTGKTAAF